MGHTDLFIYSHLILNIVITTNIMIIFQQLHQQNTDTTEAGFMAGDTVVVGRRLLWVTQVMFCLQPWRLESRYGDLASITPA
jgi:hypothetical protein